jgi:hypothetical protein
MRYRVSILLLFVFVSGCADREGKRFSILFQPFSTDLTPEALESVRIAAALAKTHPLMPLSVQGYRFRPDPVGFPTLQEQRVAVVLHALVGEGVGRWRIDVLGDGILYPLGVRMPPLPPEQVVINVGL